MTTDLLQKFKFKGQRSRSQRDITHQHQKIVTCYERIG